jgi:hypothetical protein
MLTEICCAFKVLKRVIKKKINFTRKIMLFIRMAMECSLNFQKLLFYPYFSKRWVCSFFVPFYAIPVSPSESYILSGKLRTLTPVALNGMADHYDIRNRVP